ncbi:DUF3999 domain-containing protein [Pontibacter mangrovi]|uniref:DUF3999 domain-containing protein n=1 Tax=Pontibacter mangrovi TaxID=2589816 RepID=A0A501W6D8_9BACT|nr:DUF3999 domain-containing protein [Pontibacter mangrovi]TPE43860.1 DUF3999 domain-containing protein [Pontibacter mangrovi]
MMTLPRHLVQIISSLLLLILVAWYNVANAQQYTWQAPVATPTQSGYQSILLSPEVIGRLRPDLSDLRLYDASGQEVPYLLRAEQPAQYKRLFKNYDILSYTHRQGCCSELLISNPEKRKINNISLLIGNADVRKEVKLSGSDNRKDWYVLKEHDILHAINNHESTAEAKLLDFPLSDYRYFRLQLNDSASAPLNILQAGYYDTHTEAGKYTDIPVQELTRRDSAAAKSTYIRLRFAQPVYPDRLEFTISSPQLYLREGHIQMHPAEPTHRRRSKRRQQRERQQQIVPFILNSNAPAVVDLPRQKIQELTIIIRNADNRPLEIASIRPLQLNRYMVADLSPEQAYTLRFGDPKASAPTYELQYFQDSISANLPVLLTNAPEPLQKTGKQEGSTTTSKILIWLAIGIVVIGLALMTVRMLNEMNREKRV